MQENSEQPDKVKKKLTKRELWLIGAVALLLVTTAGLLIYILIHAKHGSTPTPQNAGQDKQSQVAQALKPEDVINKIKSDWQSKYKLVDFDSTNHPAQGELAIKLEKGAPDYNVEGYDYFVNYGGGSVLTVKAYDPNPNDTMQPKKNDVALRADITDAYKNFGLTRVGIVGGVLANGGVEYYIGKGLVCSAYKSDATIGDSFASCGLIESYRPIAEQLKPFVDVIPGDNSPNVFRLVSVTDSQVSGYQKARIYKSLAYSFVGGVRVSLYRKNSGPWVYFDEGQQAFLCSDYNTTDLKNAFKGDDCIDANNNSSTVQ